MLGVGIVKTLGGVPCGPGSLLRTQKVGIKYKKPTALVVQCDVNVVRHEQAEHPDGVGGGQKSGDVRTGPVG